jgi:hypothetical protein
MADLLRVSIQGALPSGEKWSINPVFGLSPASAVSSDECADMVAAINGTAVPGQLLSLNPAGVTVTGARVEARTAAGVLQSVAEGNRGTPTPGTSSTTHPLQTSIVVSLRSTDSTARGKGRLYWPGIGCLLNATTLRFDSTPTDSALNGMDTYLGGIRTAIRSVPGFSGAFLAVWSRSNAATRAVVSLRVGNVPDVQRRRRDKVIESYISKPLS